jgi:hypothetical protein
LAQKIDSEWEYKPNQNIRILEEAHHEEHDTEVGYQPN